MIVYYELDSICNEEVTQTDFNEENPNNKWSS